MKWALRTAGWLVAGAVVLAAIFLSMRSSLPTQNLGPPPDLSVPDEPIIVPPEEPAPGPYRPSGDPVADWARIADSADPWAFDAYLSAYPGSPFVEEAIRRLTALMPAGARDGDPSELEPGAGAADPAEEALREQFRAADIAFNAPDAMMFRQTARIELALSPQTSGVAPESRLSEGLSGEIVTVEGVDYALRMQATLSGQDFEIDPEGPVARTVLSDRPTTWDWTVKPLAHGPDKPLTLRLEAVIARDGHDLPPVEIETFSATIMVEVTTWDRAVEIAKELSPLHAALVAVGGTAIVVVSWLWRLRRKPKPTPPQKVEVMHRFAGPDDAAPPKKPERDRSVSR
jgi:hypothetical protein